MTVPLLFGVWLLGVVILAPIVAYAMGRFGVEMDFEKNPGPHVLVLLWPIAPIILPSAFLASGCIRILDFFVPQLSRLHELGKEHSRPPPTPPEPEHVPGEEYRDGGRQP